MRRQRIIQATLAACVGVAVLLTVRLLAAEAPKAQGEQEAAPVDSKAEKDRTAKALSVVRNGAQSAGARAKAIQEIGFIADDPAAIGMLQAIVGDPKQDNALRLAATRKLPVFDQPAAIDALITVVEDPKAGEDLKVAAIEQLQMAAAFTPAGKERGPQILQALRKALDDPRAVVRRRAIDYLALINDEAAVNLLKAILADKGAPPASPKFTKAEAVRYLALEDPRKHFEALRPALDATDPDARSAAVTALGADPTSRPRITELLNTPAQPTQVKSAALYSLAAHDPQFPTYVTKYLEDKGLDPAVRSAAIEALGQAVNSGKVSGPRVKDLMKQIQAIPKDAPEAVRKSAAQFLELQPPAPPEPNK